jgi:hypothetical protein
LETIGGITLAKWRPNLENAAPHHTITISSFAATIHVDERVEREEDQRRQVLLATCCEEQGLVTQAERHQQHDDRDDRAGGDEAIAGGRRDERDNQAREHGEVERDVDRRALIAAGEGHLVRPRRQADRVRPGVVAPAGREGLEMPGQRAP